MSEALQTLSSGRLSAAVSPMGAQLRSLSADGRELLWGADPAWWGSSAPLLFPIVGSLNGDAYRVGGRSFSLPRHGFGRHSRFELVEAAPDLAVFRLASSEETRAIYPFDFRLDVRFRIEGARLTLTAVLANLGAGPLPASFGFHPAFNWPLAGERADHRILFDEDEPGPIRRLGADGTLEPEPIPTPVRGRVLDLRDDLFQHDALIFDRLNSRGLVYGTAEGPSLRIAFPAMPHLGIWTKPGAPFVCIEPWQGLADPQGYAGDFRDKPGVVETAPGQTRTFAMSVEVLG
jgi:galactose mutarotase-like enzyme